MTRLSVYTDGACLGNPGPGGWAWAVPGERYASGADKLTTNQRMEISAVLHALLELDGAIDIVSDSTYVVNCFRDRWWEGWLARGWKTSAKKPVANRDLWEPLVALVQHRDVTFRWVKGHSADPMNDLVDRLAVDAARTQQGRAGEGMPEGLGPGDVVVAGEDPRVPAGRRVVTAGVRPPALGGYGETALASAVRDRLAAILEAKRTLHDDLVVMTGLGLGAEQLGAEAATRAGVPFVAVLPYPDQQDVWPAASQDRYQSLLSAASGTVLLQAKRPDSKQQAGAALARRNGWLARWADEAVVVSDGSDALVARFTRSLQDRVGEENVWIVDPAEV